MRIFSKNKHYIREVPIDFQCRHKYMLLTSNVRWCYSCGTVSMGPVKSASKNKVLVPTLALPDPNCYDHDRL